MSLPAGQMTSSTYGGKSVGRIDEKSKLYDEAYGGKPVGRYRDGKIYDAPYGGEAIGSTESGDGPGYWLLEEEVE